jgi:hypothetical protein
MQNSADLVAFGQRHVAKGLSHLLEEVIQSGEGSYVTMSSGRRLLDFTCGIGVTNLGVCDASRVSNSSHLIPGNRSLSPKGLESSRGSMHEDGTCAGQSNADLL